MTLYSDTDDSVNPIDHEANMDVDEATKTLKWTCMVVDFSAAQLAAYTS